MASSEYQFGFAAGVMADFAQLPTKRLRRAVDRRLRQIAADPTGFGSLSEAGRAEYTTRAEGVLIRYGVDEEAATIWVLRIRA
jgi:hypothetical protein